MNVFNIFEIHSPAKKKFDKFWYHHIIIDKKQSLAFVSLIKDSQESLGLFTLFLGWLFGRSLFSSAFG